MNLQSLNLILLNLPLKGNIDKALDSEISNVKPSITIFFTPEL